MEKEKKKEKKKEQKDDSDSEDEKKQETLENIDTKIEEMFSFTHRNSLFFTEQQNERVSYTEENQE